MPRNNDVIQRPRQGVCAARRRIQGHRHELAHGRESELRACLAKVVSGSLCYVQEGPGQAVVKKHARRGQVDVAQASKSLD